MRLVTVLGLSATLALFAGLCPSASAQIHKDTRYGFQFKPPKDFKAVPLKPGEFTVVAKYQDSQTEYGGDQGSVPHNRSFQIQFWPNSATSPSTEDEEFDEEATATEQAEEWLDSIIGYHDVTKTKSIKVGRTKIKERHIRPDKSDDPNKPALLWYSVLLEQDDGVFVFLGNSIERSFTKSARDYAKAVKSFKRIERDQGTTESLVNDLRHMLGKEGNQEAFLQNQIDKLPPGWDHLRTKHYLFLFNADEKFVEEMAEQIEAIRKSYEKQFPPDHPLDAVGIVRVCNSRDEFMGYGGSRGSGGYFSSHHKELVFFDMRPRSATLAVLNHEAFHQYIYYFYGDLAPHSWYNEGHGDYFAGAKLTRSLRIKSFGDPPGGFGRKMAVKEACRLAESKPSDAGAAAHLRDLMQYSQQEYYKRSEIHYPQGWALVYMLREAKGLRPEWENILDNYLIKLLEARVLVAQETMDEAIANAEKAEEGSGAELSREVADWFERADEDAIQERAYELTFQTWTSEDWEDFNEFYLRYVEKL